MHKYGGLFYTVCKRFSEHNILLALGLPVMISTLLLAYHTYGNAAYLSAARRAGDFLRLAQMPDPQPAWAQQYNFQMEPSWGRKFEPPSLATHESADVIRVLVDLHLET